MTGIFSIIGLWAFFTGKIHMRNAAWQTSRSVIEGEWVRKLGLVIDLIPVFIFFVLLPMASAMQWYALRDGIMNRFMLVFGSPLLNILIYMFVGLFSKSDKDE